MRVEWCVHVPSCNRSDAGVLDCSRSFESTRQEPRIAALIRRLRRQSTAWKGPRLPEVLLSSLRANRGRVALSVELAVISNRCENVALICNRELV